MDEFDNDDVKAITKIIGENFSIEEVVKQNTSYLLNQITSVCNTYLAACQVLGIDKDTAFTELMMVQAITLTDCAVGYDVDKEKTFELVENAYNNSVSYRDKMVAEKKLTPVKPTHTGSKTVN